MNQDDLSLLVQRHLSGEASDEDLEQLDRAIVANEDLRRELLLDAGMAMQLRRLLAMPAIPPETAPVRHHWRRPLRFLIACAALVVLGVGLLLLRLPAPTAATAPTTATIPAPPAVLTASAIGHFSRLAPGTVMERGGVRFNPPAECDLVAGDSLQLPVAGEAELVYRDEAAGSGGRLRLERGTLICRIAASPAAKPLTIATRQADAVSVDGAFRIEATEASTRVQVATGSVRLAAAGSASTSMIHAGEAAVLRDGGAAPIILPASIIAWWPLDEGSGEVATDRIGTHTGSILDASWDGSGLIRFDGDQARVRIPAIGRLADLEQGDFSVLCRFRPDAYSNGQIQPEPNRQLQFLAGRQGHAIGLHFTAAGRVLMQHFLADHVPVGATSDTRLTLGRWYHLVGVVDRTQGESRLYIDGIRCARKVWPVNTATPSYGDAPWFIGRQRDGGRTFQWGASGRIRDVMLAAAALDDATVRRLCPTP